MKARAWALVCLATLGCKTLPEIEPGACGNGVLEPPEDCDGFPIDGVQCRPRGSAGECRLDCTPDPSGADTPCPKGWGCAAGGICRPATGQYSMAEDDIPGNANALLAGDFDDDGKEDIVGVERATAFGLSNLRVHYFDDDAKPARTWTSDKFFASPKITDVTEDGRSDIVFSNGSAAVMAGEPDRSLLPEAYPSYFLGEAAARGIVVYDQLIEDSAAFVILARRESVNEIFISDPVANVITTLAEAPGRVEDLAAEPAVGRIHEDEARFPCLDFALAYRDHTELNIYSTCELDAGVVKWRSQAHVETIRLEPPADIKQGLVLADFDGDGHVDIAVGTAEGTYLARGTGDGVGPAEPHAFLTPPDPSSGEAADLGMPIAGGDLTRDGVAELVFPSGLANAFSDPAWEGVRYAVTHAKFGEQWTEALFADFNANGLLDVACASNTGLNVDFFNGTGELGVNQFEIRTDRPVERLAVGDFDGDLVNDLAFVELRSLSQNKEQVSMAFGRTAGPPEAPVAAVHLENVDQIASFAADPTSVLANLVMIFEQPNRDPALPPERALGFLVGSSDRSPPAPIELSTFFDDGSLQTWTSIALAVGSFVEPDKQDLVPFSLIRSDTRDVLHNPMDEDFGTFFLKDIAGRRDAPQLMGAGLPSGMEPIGDHDELSIRLGSGDLDGDGLDELVMVAPGGGGSRCIVNLSRVIMSDEPEPKPELVEIQVLSLESHCYETDFDVVDLDGDDAPELVLLLGDGSKRELAVLWNDGSGGFDGNDLSSIAVSGETPLAFTHFRATKDSPLMVAYVTGTSVRLLGSLGAERAFRDEGSILGLNHATGIVAADVNGDRVTDLAVADSGSVRVLKAVLKP